jgi:hypothetical protein
MSDLLGLRLPTLAGDTLDSGVLAVGVTPPPDTWGRLGPFVWSRTPVDAFRKFGVPMDANYTALAYPPRLIAEVYLNTEAPDGARFRPTDRLGDYVGAEIGAGAIRHGAVYLCVSRQGAWRLFEYPELPANEDCVNLVWPFNAPDAAGSRRAFVPPPWLVKEQTAHQVITVDELSAGGDPPRNIGPSVIFRTDASASRRETDILVVAPFLYLDNPSLLQEMVYGLPMRDGSLPDPDHLIVAAGDLHYVAFGELRPLLREGVTLRTIERTTPGGRSLDYTARANAVALYLGLGNPAAGIVP